MKRTRLLWKIYPYFVFISTLSTIFVTIIACLTIRYFYYEQKEVDLSARANIASYHFLDHLKKKDYKAVKAYCDIIGKSSKTRFTVVLPSGEIVGDSVENSKAMEAHSFRSEIKRAFYEKKTSSAVRYSSSTEGEYMFLAVPVFDESKVIGVVRASIPLRDINITLYSIYENIFMSFILLILVVTFLSLFASKKISDPIESIKNQAENIVLSGDNIRVSLYKKEPVELYKLALVINRITLNLKDKVKQVLRVNQEQAAVYSAVLDGIFALNKERKIVHCNEAALRMFDLKESSFKYTSIEESIRNIDFQNFFNESCETSLKLEKEIEIYNDKSCFYYLRSSPLISNNGMQSGVVIVVSDLTKIKQLEDCRRDFVANVSHELRTPLTSIKGFSETILDHSLTDIDEIKDFVRIIYDHSNRLSGIIEDLLNLANIEENTGNKSLEKTSYFVKPMIESAVKTCSYLVLNNKASINISCDSNLKVIMSSKLIEQAVVNLLENAIKYSHLECKISVFVSNSKSSINIAISDNGPGINKKYISRLFERFYRVKNNSENLVKGSGLGLSIVKHIISAHGGSVNVKSELGKGSTFFIIIPT